MSYWNDLGFLQKDTSKRCYKTAILYERADDSILEKVFRYDDGDLSYVETSGVIGEFTTKSKTIYTPDYMNNFCRGARVKFADGTELTIKDINEVTDSKKALADGKGLIGLNITF